MWAAAALCILTYILDSKGSIQNVYLAVALALVIIITGTFAFMQERKSGNLMKKFASLLPPASMVRQDTCWGLGGVEQDMTLLSGVRLL